MIHQSISLLGYNIFSGKKQFFSNNFEGIVSTINPNTFIIAQKDSLFRNALMESDFLLPDGVGISLAAIIIRGIKVKRISGGDLHLAIIQAMAQRKGRCFYMGSSYNTLELIRKRIKEEFPSITTGFYSPPYKPHFSKDDNVKMISAINEFRPDVLFVGMTAPKQEKWVYENKTKINAPIICSIGAVFDFYAGTVKRSGKFWINLGLEWLPRLIREPHRLWRRTMISAPLFLWYVLKEKIKLVLKLPKDK